MTGMDRATQFRAVCCDLVADVAQTTGTVQLSVSGGSMLPCLWPGDRVTVSRCQVSDLRPGEIVVYRQDGRLIIHRVVSVSEGEVIARGDAVSGNDAPVAASEVVGKVTGATREGKPLNLRLLPLRMMVARGLFRSEMAKRILLGGSRRLRKAKIGIPGEAA